MTLSICSWNGYSILRQATTQTHRWWFYVATSFLRDADTKSYVISTLNVYIKRDFCFDEYTILKPDWISNMRQMHISGIEPSSVILSQTNYCKIWPFIRLWEIIFNSQEKKYRGLQNLQINLLRKKLYTCAILLLHLSRLGHIWDTVIEMCWRTEEEVGPTIGLPHHRHFVGLFNVSV